MAARKSTQSCGVAHVVEEDARRVGGVGGAQPDPPAGGRARGAGVDLEAVGRPQPVVAHRQRQEVELHVGPGDVGTRAQEGRGLELVRGAGARAGQQPARADRRLAEQGPVAVQADRALARHLHVDFHVVLQVRADAGAVGDDVDAVAPEFGPRTDSREHQQLGRVEGRGAQDHLGARDDAPAFAAHAHRDAGGAALAQHDAFDHAAHQPRAQAAGGAQVAVGGRPAAPLPDAGIEGAEAFLAGAVVIRGVGVAGLLPRRDEGRDQRVAPGSAPDPHRAGRAAQRRVAAAAGIVPRLDPAEVGFDVGPAPAGGAGGLPGVVILRVATHPDHAVDRRGAAHDLAARRRQPAPAERGFGLGAVAPVVARHAHRIAERAGHADQRAGVGTAVFHHDDRVPRLGQPVRHCAPGRTRADDDVVRLHTLLPFPRC